MNHETARTAVQGVVDFLRKGGDLTETERQALAAFDCDEEAAIERGVAALTEPAAEVTETSGTVETFVLFPNVQRRQPEQGVCAWCEDVWPVDELALDGNLDLVCCDCRSTDTSAGDSAAFRAYAMGR